MRHSVRPPVEALAILTLTGVTVVAVLALLVTAAGYDAARALRAMWDGSLGSSYAIFSSTLVRATPLILTGLAVALAFRCGILNIGAEGQFLAGATAAAASVLAWGEALGPGTVVVALAAGAVLGAAWALPAAWLRARFGVLEVISTIMMNFIALYAVSYLVRGPLQEPLGIYPQSATISAAAQMPTIVPRTRLHAGFILAIGSAVVAWWTLRATAAGFRLRATGASPTAAQSAGRIDVGRTVARTFLVSGALAGIAGAVELTAVTYALYENISPGYGYTAIAVALLARLSPLLVIGSGIFIGALEAGAGAMQRDAGVPSVLISVIEALIILAVVSGGYARRLIVGFLNRSVGADAHQAPAETTHT